MKGHWFEFENRKIYLEEQEMFKVHEYYVIQQNADYFRENYPFLPEDKIMEIAYAWRDKEMQDGYSNEEALSEVLEEYDLLDEDFDDSEAWEDDSDRSCKDCPPSECTGHCMSCYYRTV
jgi:hypothetical protein